MKRFVCIPLVASSLCSGVRNNYLPDYADIATLSLKRACKPLIEHCFKITSHVGIAYNEEQIQSVLPAIQYHENNILKQVRGVIHYSS